MQQLNRTTPAPVAAGNEGAKQSGQSDYSIIDENSANFIINNYPCCFLKSLPDDPKAPEGSAWTTRPRNFKAWKPNKGIGIICGYEVEGVYVNAIDVDARHPELATTFAGYLAQKFKDKDGTQLQRVGEPPKFLIPFVTDAPLKADKRPEYWPAGEAQEKANKNQLEILGTGNQFVAYQIHPGTGKPYQWSAFGEEAPFMDQLYSTTPANLLKLTPDEVAEIKAEFDVLADCLGLVPKISAKKPAKSKGSDQEQSLYDLDEVLSYIPIESLDYNDWGPRIGGAIHAVTNGQGYDQWVKLSQRSSKHNEKEMPKKWASFGSHQTPAGMGTLVYLAKQGGMPSKAIQTASEPPQSPKPPEPGQWPTPVDLFSETPVPAFPNAILPKAFQDLANEKSAQSGFDPGAYGFCLFVAAANTIDHRAKLDLGPFRVPAFQWGGLVGDSGTAKSPILNDAKRSVDQIDKALLDESNRALSRWINACQRAKEDKGEAPPKPPWKQRNALDTTTEALGLLLLDNPEGVNMYHHEITELIGRMDAYSGKDGGKDRGVYLRSYDGGYVTINRAGRAQPLVIDNFSVGILAGIQPEKLAYLFKKSGGGSDGLYQRFLMYCLQPAGEVDYMAKESPFTQNNVDMIFERIHNWTGEVRVSARLTDPAKQLMQDYHNNIRKLASRTPAQRFAEHLNKFPGMLGRVAFALHCIHAAANDEKPGPLVDSGIMNQAIVLMRVMYRHSEAVYHILDQAAGDVRGLVVSAAEAILSKSWDTFKRGDLTRHATHWQGADSRQTEGAIDYLIELGWIADITPPATPGRRGRRSDGVYAVNPEVFQRYKGHRDRITEARAERYKAIQEATVN
ncbi:DUF3987 domain-containing protein [Marinobacter nauticus]|uniref:Bifunctional DNA primase/polymerase-like protein n=1 Tax=Marinobacter nauticus TaxID=2743 RepID=A0A368UT16_MARNT|nr:bifunctional DNA primase/polymerase-like protein [Marinobacter nauticus]RCW31245.1 bifunctional DNA primase/polymerase-like protein [Marinobacter nauticus]